jgi:hypothetical protein
VSEAHATNLEVLTGEWPSGPKVTFAFVGTLACLVMRVISTPNGRVMSTCLMIGMEMEAKSILMHFNTAYRHRARSKLMGFVLLTGCTRLAMMW